MPKVGDAVDEVVVAEIVVTPGTAVTEGQVLYTVETDKTQVEVPAVCRHRQGNPDQGGRRGEDRRADHRARGLIEVPRVHSAREERFGGYLEDYEAGDRFVHWPGKTITEADDHLFCLLTMATSPLHIDRAYAESSTIFGKNVVVGTYIYSLLLGMSMPDISGRALANLSTSDLRHLAPVFHGDTLYGETEILGVRGLRIPAG